MAYRSFSRREFLAASAAAAGVTALAARPTCAQDTADIRVAVIGIRGQGQTHIAALHDNVVALCDVDRQILADRAAMVEEKFQRKVETFVDFRRLLDRQDIDAVSIATPNHSHALITILAAQAGKDVYVEKPASHNIWEGRQMVAAARRFGRVIQCGTQSRSSPSLAEAVEFVRSGQLGKVQYAIGTCFKPRPSIGRLTSPLQIPAHIDYELWCGPAEKRDLFRPQLHYDWHWDSNTGNGDLGNQGIHQVDIARWFLGERGIAPRVISIGGRLGYDDAGDTPNTQVVFYEFPTAPLLFEIRGLPRSKASQADWTRSMDSFRESTVGVIVQCVDGHVLVPDYHQAIAFDRQGNVVRRWAGGGDHHANWLAAVAAHDASLLTAEISEGHISSALCHAGMVSHRLGSAQLAVDIARQLAANDLLSSAFERMAGHLRANGVDIDSGGGRLMLGPWLAVDTTTQQMTGHEGASALFSREYRHPFVVPDLESAGIEDPAGQYGKSDFNGSVRQHV
jgi:predicted dehydrogenase